MLWLQNNFNILCDLKTDTFVLKTCQGHVINMCYSTTLISLWNCHETCCKKCNVFAESNRNHIALLRNGMNHIIFYPYLPRILSIINVLYRWPHIASASVMEMHNSTVFGASFGIHVFKWILFQLFHFCESVHLDSFHLGIWKVHVLCINHLHQAEVFVWWTNSLIFFSFGYITVCQWLEIVQRRGNEY